jgi:uncharacterized repeat protein (TIGR01451 family)
MARRLVAIGVMALAIAGGLPLASARLQDPTAPAEAGSKPTTKADSKTPTKPGPKKAPAPAPKPAEPPPIIEPEPRPTDSTTGSTISTTPPPLPGDPDSSSGQPSAPTEGRTGTSTAPATTPGVPVDATPPEPSAASLLAEPPSPTPAVDAPAAPTVDRRTSRGITTAPPLTPTPPSNRPDRPLRDDVQQVQAPGSPILDGNPNLPAARPAAGGAGAVATPAAQGDPYLPSPDRLPMGSHAVGLTIDVRAPATANLKKETVFKIVVKNTGGSDAMGVVVRDQLPEELKFLGSKPDPVLTTPALTWQLGTVPAGGEKVITLNVEPQKPGIWDHAATVTAMGGSRSRIQVKQPRFRVDQSVGSSKEVLKGDQVQFNINVANVGDGPARDVVVRAELSPGLKHEQGQLLELPFKKAFGKTSLGPNESVPLTLVVDAVASGEQWCKVTATSRDVVPDAPESQNTQTVNVSAADVKLTLRGSTKRPAETLARYTLIVENSGNAPARNVRAAAWVPFGCRLEDDGKAEWKAQIRRLLWTVGQLEPGDKKEFNFLIRLGKPQSYQVDAVAEGFSSSLKLRDEKKLDVQAIGTPRVQYTVTERRQALDVGDETAFVIRVQNQGLSEARNLLFSFELSDQLQFVEGRADSGPQPQFDAANKRWKFPVIEQLGAKEQAELTIRAKATKAGHATCNIFLTYEGLDGNSIQHTAIVPIADAAEAPN